MLNLKDRDQGFHTYGLFFMECVCGQLKPVRDPVVLCW